MARFGSVQRVGVPLNSDQAGVHALVAYRVRQAREMAVAIPNEQAAFRELLQGRTAHDDAANFAASPTLL